MALWARQNPSQGVLSPGPQSSPRPCCFPKIAFNNPISLGGMVREARFASFASFAEHPSITYQHGAQPPACIPRREGDRYGYPPADRPGINSSQSRERLMRMASGRWSWWFEGMRSYPAPPTVARSRSGPFCSFRSGSPLQLTEWRGGVTLKSKLSFSNYYKAWRQWVVCRHGLEP